MNSPALWSFLRLSVLMVALTATLYLTASSFDSTEIKSIIAMFLFGAGAEGASHAFTKGK